MRLGTAELPRRRWVFQRPVPFSESGQREFGPAAIAIYPDSGPPVGQNILGAWCNFLVAVMRRFLG